MIEKNRNIGEIDIIPFSLNSDSILHNFLKMTR